MTDNKVYLVTDGEYSDYHIVAAFSTRKGAAAFRKKTGGQVEEYTLDAPYTAKELQARGYKTYCFEMKEDGSLRYEPREEHGTAPASTFQMRRAFDHDAEVHVLYCLVLAKSVKAAVKIANEKRAQIVALNQWTPWGHFSTEAPK
jgi:hypothetical protein